MKKNRPKTGDRSHSMSTKQLASVRGGGIQGSGFTADSGVIHLPHIIHLPD